MIAEGRTVTYDLGGTAGTREFGEAVATRMRHRPDPRRFG